MRINMSIKGKYIVKPCHLLDSHTANGTDNIYTLKITKDLCITIYDKPENVELEYKYNSVSTWKSFDSKWDMKEWLYTVLNVFITDKQFLYN